MPARTGPRLIRMRAGTTGYSEDAAWMCVRYILAKTTPLVHLFSCISMDTHNHITKAEETEMSMWEQLLFSLLHPLRHYLVLIISNYLLG